MRYAIVSGGTHGIGRAITEKLLAEGFSVAICGRNKEDLAAREAEWNEQYPEASILALQADLSRKEEAQSFGTAVLANFPQVDLLVNNVGTYYPGSISREPDGALEELIGINLYSAYHLTRALLPAMKEKKSGHIFNMCSIASLHAYPNGGAYSISKYGLLGFSENLREELKTENIKVTAICSGAVYSRSWEGSDIDPGRIMEPPDIATMLWAAYTLSAGATVETIVMRPQQGDL
ncbi:MAG: short-chain dehydrogenase [Bacteroidetes bacterium 46-16]|nr:MAG: short-chain dehydrogenase [Bacteroidetes bacterium 46-16]